MNGQQIVTCPHCGGNKVKSSDIMPKFFFWSGVFCCVTIIGIPLGIVLFIASFVTKKTKLKLKFFCQECKHSFKVNEGRYLSYKDQMNILENHADATTEASVGVKVQPSTINQTKTQVQPKKILSFNVAGVTFENDKGQNIQSILRKIVKNIATDQDIPAYSGYTNKEILENDDSISEFEDVEFGEYIKFEKDPNNEFDKNAIKVIIEYPEGKIHHIGHVPKKENIEVSKLMDSNSIDYIDAQLVGGKIKEVEYDDEKDKDIVVINELTYGVEITIHVKEAVS